MEMINNKLKKSLLEVNKQACKELPLQAKNDLALAVIIEDVIIAVMKEIGDGWEDGSVALSQIYMSGKYVEEFVDSILPSGHPQSKFQPKKGIAVLEDYHMLDKRIIYSILRASGFELIDYRHSTVDGLVKKIAEDKLDNILISTLMLPSALKVKEIVQKLDLANIL